MTPPPPSRSRGLRLLLAGALLTVATVPAFGKDVCEPSLDSSAYAIAVCLNPLTVETLVPRLEHELRLEKPMARRLAAVAVEGVRLVSMDAAARAAEAPAVRDLQRQLVELLIAGEAGKIVARDTAIVHRLLDLELPPELVAWITAPDGEPGRARVVIHFTTWGYAGGDLDLVSAALAAHPGSVALWWRLGDLSYGPWRIACSLEALRRLPARRRLRPVRIAMVRAVVTDLIAAGLPEEAVATLAGESPAVIRGVSAHYSYPEATCADVDGLPVCAVPAFERLDLAAAYALAGDRARAAEILAKVKEGLPGDYLDPRILRRAAVARLLAPDPQRDPFRLLAEAVAADDDYSYSVLGNKTRRRVVASVAAETGYPEIEAHVLRGLLEILEEQEEIFADEVPTVPVAAVAAEAGRFVDAVEALRERSSRRLAALTPAEDAPLLAAVARAAAAPAGPSWAAPRGPAELGAGPPEEEPWDAPPVESVSPPAGSCALRTERRGRTAVALSLSRDVDPTGDDSAGGYWIRISRDAGVTWSRPLYSGLRQDEPYRIADTARPLVNGEELHLTVDGEPACEAGGVAPPLLVLPISALERDADGDGLTDLAEAALFLDPQAADSDGDGQDDASDPLPNVPRGSGEPGALGAALAFVADHRAKMVERALPDSVDCEVEPGNPWKCLSAARKASRSCGGSFDPGPGPEATLFVTGDRAAYAALDPPQRVVVLTAAETEAVLRTRPWFHTLRFELFAVNRAGSAAIALYTEDWHGGGVLVTRRADGTWESDAKTIWGSPSTFFTEPEQADP